MPDEPNRVEQNEIEELLKQAGAASGAAATSGEPSANVSQSEIENLLGGAAARVPPVAPVTASRSAAPQLPLEDEMARGDVEFLLNQAQEALASIHSPNQPDLAAPATPFRLHEFTGAPPSSERATLDLIRDVDLDLKIELGRTQMYLEDVLKLRRGSVVPLDKLAGDPVDIYVNGRLIARGEVLVLNDNFCVRIAELIAGESAKAG